MSSLILNSEPSVNIRCECSLCTGEGRPGSALPKERASEAKPDEYVVMWQEGTFCTITSCKAYAVKMQANEDYITIWQNWLKTQMDANVPIQNIIRHSFRPNENIPTVQWLQNVDNFNLIRDFMFLDESYIETPVFLEYLRQEGAYEGIIKQNDKCATEKAIMKYIYGLYHCVTIHLLIYEKNFPYKEEIQLLEDYYNLDDDNALNLELHIPYNYDLGKYYKEQIQRVKELKSAGTYKPQPIIHRRLITLKMI
jgi:hypothetical protein